MSASYGWKVQHNEASGPRGIIGEPERSTKGNLVLRVGRVSDRMEGLARGLRYDAWRQTEYVVLTPEEARDYFGRVAALLDPLVAVERSQVAREAIELFLRTASGRLEDPDVLMQAVDATVRAVAVGREQV